MHFQALNNVCTILDDAAFKITKMKNANNYATRKTDANKEK
jgi:hypothetical protein